jgi:hypothetical protein
MNGQRAFWLVGLIILAGLTAPAVAQTITLSASVVGAGGGVTGDATYRLIGTVAQPAAGFVQDNTRALGMGFWYSSLGYLTDVDQVPDGLPTEFLLKQNFPNPFNPGTEFRFEVPVASDVRLVVYDLLGREVRIVANGQLSPGRYNLPFNASHLASGVYLYRLEARSERGLFMDVKKMILVK